MLATAGTKIRLYVAEEQQILREAYQSFLSSRPDMELVAHSSDTDGESLARAALTLRPDVMLLGFKTLQPATVEKLGIIRDNCPDVGIVLLSAYYDIKAIKALREFTRHTSAGCAYLVKHTVDTVEQLTQVINSVAEKRIIIDPTVMEGLISAADSSTYLKELTARELEVLGWVAKGYRNNTIAEVLCLDPKTVERHINNIYGKLGNCPESKHPRVYAVMYYLRALGMLPDDAFASAG